MRNIFLFIRRYFTIISFFILQGIALWMLFTYNRFHRGRGLGVASNITGWTNSKYNKLEDFFRMVEENKRLLKMNDSLMNLQSFNFVLQDSAKKITRDSIPFDSTGRYRQFLWRDAQVVYNTVTSDKNYFQINKGSRQGIKENMGVFGAGGGLAGMIVNVGSDYSTAMSLLHVQSRVNAIIKRTKSVGTLQWDGKSPHFLTLSNIPQEDSLVKGDTILTGNYSLSFPPGQMIGTIDKILTEKSSTFYILKIKPTTRFSTLQQVMVVENIQYTTQKELLNDTRKKIEDNKKK